MSRYILIYVHGYAYALEGWRAPRTFTSLCIFLQALPCCLSSWRDSHVLRYRAPSLLFSFAYSCCSNTRCQNKCTEIYLFFSFAFSLALSHYSHDQECQHRTFLRLRRIKRRLHCRNAEVTSTGTKEMGIIITGHTHLEWMWVLIAHRRGRASWVQQLRNLRRWASAGPLPPSSRRVLSSQAAQSSCLYFRIRVHLCRPRVQMHTTVIIQIGHTLPTARCHPCRMASRHIRLSRRWVMGFRGGSSPSLHLPRLHCRMASCR